MKPPQTSGFTLIELLVVVTIIVVLLALLVPAMDKAIAQAEMVVCGTQVRNLATGAINYALNNKRTYASRIAESQGEQPVTIQKGGQSDLPRFKGYYAMGINGQMNCPLTGAVDVEGSQADTWILAPYAMYFGWRYHVNGVPQQGMTKVGGRLTWLGDSSTVLAGDDSLVILSDNWGHGTHPDADGKWAQLVYQDQGLLGLPQATAGPAGLKATFSRYTGPPANRGTVDLNFAFQDGSVKRYDKVDYRTGQPTDPELRTDIFAVPYTSMSGESTNYYRHVPNQ